MNVLACYPPLRFQPPPALAKGGWSAQSGLARTEAGEMRTRILKVECSLVSSRLVFLSHLISAVLPAFLFLFDQARSRSGKKASLRGSTLMQVRNVRLWAAALLAVVLAAASAPTIAYARPGSENESYARYNKRGCNLCLCVV